MTAELSISGKVRLRLARMLWPEPAVAAPAWTFAGDGMMTVHNADFLREPRFAEAYRLAKATGAWHGADIQWRAYTVCWAAMKGRSLEGDYVECGVDRGGFSRAAMHYIGFGELRQKKFYLVDTFAGIPAESLAGDPNSELLATRYDHTYADVVRTFAPFPNAVVIRGAVPEILPAVGAEKVCYLCIDLNTAAPSIAAAEFFWDRLVSGAVMVLDDYAQLLFADQKRAFDAFARQRGVEVLSLPTGQGLIFKP